MSDSTRLAPACLPSDAKPVAPFDALEDWVRDYPLTRGARELYAALRSCARLRLTPTHADLAARIRCSRRSVIRWLQALVRAGLVAVRRWGQGRPNTYSLAVGLRSDKPAPPVVRPMHAERRDSVKVEKNYRHNRNPGRDSRNGLEADWAYYFAGRRAAEALARLGAARLRE